MKILAIQDLTPGATILALAAIALFAAMLRLDAVTAKYGWLDQPAWALRLEGTLVPVSRAVLPAAVSWGRVETGYAGADPINYLKYAREMRHFYQAHVREPVFLALTRLMLRVTGGRDIAVSFASALSSTLAVLATFLLGAAVSSRAAGLIAAAALAIELDAVTWSADGWRDDTFMLFVALCGWAFVRLLTRPTPAMAVTAGVVAAGACLTRITALSFVLPALLWIALRRSANRANSHLPTSSVPVSAGIGSRRAAAITATLATLLVVPYLINCARETGDPFYAINYHTRYYRAAEGLPQDHNVGAFRYVTGKLHARPISTVDTAAVGILVFPFTKKWSGFRPWSSHLASLLQWLAIVGLILAWWSPVGRFLWLMLVTSLVPYAVTWPLGGGGEWRFTQHVYPFYLSAAASAVVLIARSIRRLASRRFDVRLLFTRRRLTGMIVCALVLVTGVTLYWALPYFVVREALAAGEPVSIGLGSRDDVFFRSNWSAPKGAGNVFVRTAVGDRVSIRLPLPLRDEHQLTLRMDGLDTDDPAYQPKVTVFLDNHAVGQVRFQRDPARVGAYRMRIPAELAGRSFSRLDLVASHSVRAADAGPRFAWLSAETRVAFYLWYVRVEPRPTSPHVP